MKIIEELLKGEKVECAKIAQLQNKGAGHTQLSSLNSQLSFLISQFPSLRKWGLCAEKKEDVPILTHPLTVKTDCLYLFYSAANRKV